MSEPTYGPGDVYRAEVPLVDVKALHSDPDYRARAAGDTVRYEDLTTREQSALAGMIERGFWRRVTSVAPAEEKPAKPKKEAEA